MSFSDIVRAIVVSHINPAAEMVVVKLSGHSVAGADFTHALTLKAWTALAQAVRQ